ncbi:PREDICTED: uncharacterized protein LOC106812707 [Priapulus caudatus]|uniref:Uncharacterized protein LOC106812707 n=1 Tax=Priapulus caudatus TaxID=37621 RepID=A0ABM1EIW5_PRICU|nr:PREDICTED: uncharacterized protein LOC106812707 [Priapulus caudatus]
MKNHGAPKEYWNTYEIRQITTAKGKTKAKQRQSIHLTCSQRRTMVRRKERKGTQLNRIVTWRFPPHTKKKAMERGSLPLPPSPPTMLQKSMPVADETTQQACQRERHAQQWSDSSSGCWRRCARMLHRTRGSSTCF